MPLARRVRVVHLLSGCRMGGLERVALEIVERLRAVFEFRLVTFDDPQGPLRAGFDAAGVPVTFLRRRPGVDLAYPVRLARWLRRENVDLIHAHNGTALFYGALAARLARRPRLVFTAHDHTVPQVRSRPLQHLLGRTTACAVAVSELGRRELLGVTGFDPDRVIVVHNGVHNGVHNSLHAGARPERSAARVALGVPTDAEVAGTVARLHPEKNVPGLVRAFSLLAAARPRAHLLIAGDGPVRAARRALAEDAGLQSRVHLLGERSDVGRILAALDVFVLASEREGLPLAVLEAMGAGLPVVATDGVTGRLVRPGDAEALASSVADLLSDADRARELGRRGREVFLAGFTADRMAAAYGRVYRDVLEGVS